MDELVDYLADLLRRDAAKPMPNNTREAGSGTLVEVIVIESVCLGFLGACIGLAKLISLVGIPMPPPPNADQGCVSHILVVPSVVGLAFVVGLLSAVLASLKPAFSISHKPIAET